MSDGQPQKRCTKCGGLFPLTADFFDRHYESRRGRYRYEAFCKECRRERQRSTHRRDYDAKRLRDESEHREKLRARWTLRDAVRHGVIVRPTTCQDCGTDCSPHGHHEDYAKPFEVEWLCTSCHGKRHRKEQAA